MTAVSVIIPVYNAEQWIGRTLESVLAQTFKDIEVLVIDDGSQDGSAEIIRRYPVQYFRQENAGQAAAFNAGLRRARGELIAFLDADDLWLPGKLSACVAALRAQPEAVLCYTNGDAIGPHDELLWRLLPDEHVPPSASGMLLDCVICCPAQVVARAAQLQPFTEGLQSTDHDQWVRMREKGPFAYIAEPLSQYRRRPGQQSLSRRQWEDGFTILASARRRYPYPKSTLRRRAAVIHYRLGEYDLRHGARVSGLTHWLRAGVLDPARAWQELRGRL
jgi:glycosyltransferase involved in cell wall biosynthesis